MPKKSTVRTQPNNIDTLCKAQKKTQREIAQKINFTEGYIASARNIKLAKRGGRRETATDAKRSISRRGA